MGTHPIDSIHDEGRSAGAHRTRVRAEAEGRMRATFSRNQLERIAERYLEQTRASGIAVFVTQAAAHFGIALDFYLGDESPLMRHMLPLTILRTERAAASRIEYIQIGHSADDLDRRRIGKIPESAMICIARDGEVRGGILLVNLPTTHERARLDRLLLHTHNALASALILRTCEIAFEPLAPIIAGLEPLAVYSRERTIVLGASDSARARGIHVGRAMPRALVPSPLALSGIASSPFDHVVQLQNGETVRIVSRLVEAAGAPLVVARLIPRATPRRTMQLRLDLEKQAPSFAESVDGLWEYDVATRRFYFSSRWCEMLGYEPDAIIPTIESWIDLVHPDDRDPVQRALAQVTSESSERFDAEYRMRRRTGDHIWIHGRGIARRDESGRLQRVVGAHTDITRRKETERELFFAAFHDALTGLPNRALLVERIGQSLALQQRAPERRFAVLFLDIDRFKSINDAHGHRVGDAVIIELGKRLKSCIRERDTLSRMGGDEFAVILADVAARQDVVLVAERIQQSLATHPLEKARAGCITVSIGIAINHGGYQSADEILHDADMAMYEAKSGGGSRFVIVEHPSD